MDVFHHDPSHIHATIKSRANSIIHWEKMPIQFPDPVRFCFPRHEVEMFLKPRIKARRKALSNGEEGTLQE
jgi:hypothetical protein